MELCCRCKRMTAETNHYTGDVICYARDCRYIEPAKKAKPKFSTREKVEGEKNEQ
jgi:hypothetical protein